MPKMVGTGSGADIEGSVEGSQANAPASDKEHRLCSCADVGWSASCIAYRLGSMTWCGEW
jgi:hypothetical protein